MTPPSGAPRTLELLALSAGHFAANVDLGKGRVTFTIDVAVHRGGRATGSFSQQIEREVRDAPSTTPPRRRRPAAG